MIKANELRLFNMVDWKGYVSTLLRIEFDQDDGGEYLIKVSDKFGGVACPDINEIDPIPLTPEWMEMFGFKKTMFVYPGDPKTEAVEAFVKDKFVIRWIDNVTYASYRTEYFPYRQSQNSLPGDMLYVHQLQNNYYWWTNGEELALTQPV